MIADEYKQNSSLETDIGKGITEIISGVSKQKKTFKQNLKSVKNKDAKILLEQSLKRTKMVLCQDLVQVKMRFSSS